MTAFDSKLRPAADVLVQVVEGESVLLHLGEQCYYGLDATGTRMWELLTTSDSVEMAYRALLEEFDVAPEPLRADLARLVDSLLTNGLLEVTSGAVVARGAGNE